MSSSVLTLLLLYSWDGFMGGDGRGGSDSHRLDAANAGRGGANGDRGEEEDAARKRKILSGRRRIADRRFSTMGFCCCCCRCRCRCCCCCWAGRSFCVCDGGDSLVSVTHFLTFNKLDGMDDSWRVVVKVVG